MLNQIEVLLYGDKEFTQEVAKVRIENTEYKSLSDVIKVIYNAYLPDEAEPKDLNQDNLIEKGVVGFRAIGLPITIKDEKDLHALIFAMNVKHYLNQ
ncbi:MULTISPECIES: hypothetical protein [Klebsiella]|jgi:hypothetical protein|uniref:hypothetical protein n=1 Tax=Klebsiella TaxID=570 RepID=UPI0007CC6F3E|nr:MULTISPECIES: hypothetical protein [Klebsiella]AWB61946.1 hypothetical protein CUC76_10215 [Enterobacteriaceae bacterium S05]HBR1510218.1 hypothetical protein [Klebsiella quasipneumoniae subsp. quasipneumoniae]EIX9527487.1 hypothetical protein [Klebsiella pneumoniae]ELJ5745077.1 hypothetical protein [Klebsiella quasipneumoniae]MBD0875893.1 hypothetical protein [Klebsiella pneumoniae]